MSLAITAAPFDTDDTNSSNYNNNDTPINKKRQTSAKPHTHTQKRMPLGDFNSEKVNSVLESIHNNSTDNELGDYNPKKNHSPAKSNNSSLNPLESPSFKEGLTNNSTAPLPLDNGEMELQELQSAFLNDAQVRDYYKKLLPGHNATERATERATGHNKAYYQQRNMNEHTTTSTNEDLLIKLNYMINLLEDQQDERTNNVTEEVVLYSFLGIFIIFVVDSFARVGKYTR